MNVYVGIGVNVYMKVNVDMYVNVNADVNMDDNVDVCVCVCELTRLYMEADVLIGMLIYMYVCMRACMML